MRRLRLVFAGIVLAAVTLVAGCGRSNATAEAAAAEPKVLRIAFVPQVDMEERFAAAYRALEDYLERALMMPVEVTAIESATTALESLRADKLDVCNFSPWPFLLAEEKIGLEMLVVTGAEDGQPVSYRTVLVARPELGLRNVDDLAARAKEIVFSFEEAVSTSGHLVPRAFLHEVGISPERDFKQLLFSPDSSISLLAVKSDRIDVVAVSNTGLARALEKKRIAPGDVSVIWTSPPVLANITAIRRELPADFKARVRAAYLAMPETAPAEWAQVARQYSLPVSRYLPATDTMIAPLRAAIRDVPGLQLAM